MSVLCVHQFVTGFEFVLGIALRIRSLKVG
jgi:hypothetical protein